MEKQIEEMANVIHKGELDRNKGVLDCTEFTTDLVVKVGLQRLAGAKALYNAGYRRQEDVAREIFADILGCLRYTQFMNDISKKSTIAYINYLKKKYGVTEE